MSYQEIPIGRNYEVAPSFYIFVTHVMSCGKDSWVRLVEGVDPERIVYMARIDPELVTVMGNIFIIAHVDPLSIIHDGMNISKARLMKGNYKSYYGTENTKVKATDYGQIGYQG